ncbi:MAG: type IV pilus secretin PilQ [Myxococcota bacterium]
MTRQGVSLTMWTLRTIAAVALAALLPSAEALGAETKTISAVEVQGEGGMTRIVLRGAKDAIYTAFMREDPPRLILELPDVAFEGVNTPISVRNGLVEDVTLGAFGDAKSGHGMARVSIALAQASDYEVKPAGDEIIVEVRPSGTASSEPAPSQPGPPEVAPETATEPAATPPAAEPTASAPTDAAPAAPTAVKTAPKIKSIVTHGTDVEIEASGPIDNVDSFKLANPDRVVVDLFGAKSGIAGAKQSFAEGVVSQARIGEHPDKVRVVLDLRSPTGKPTVVPTANGVRIELGQGESATAATPTETASNVPAAAAPAGDEPAAAPATETAPAAEPSGDPAVQSVHFESLPEFDRVVITLGRKVKASQFAPDPSTLIVMLKDATIDAATERRVDTKEFGGPIEMFSVFNTPDVPAPEVRVVLKRGVPEAAKLSWEGAQLKIEMPRPAGSAPATRDATTAPATGDAATPPGAAAARSANDKPTEADAGSAPTDAAALAPADGASEPASPEASPIPTEAPAAPAPLKTATGEQVAYDPFLDGPADPASIDLLAEGGFDEEKSYQGRRVSLDFKDADIANILRLIAEVSDLNVIAGQEVTGKVTIRLVDVPWDQALDVILLTKGLGFVRIGNILRIAPVETLKMESEARLQDRRSREKLEDLVVKLQPVNFAKASDLGKLVKRLLSSRGSVNVDDRTNTLIIKDIPSVIHEATALVKAVDTQTPQVLIEAKIVEATLNFSRGLGVLWGVGWDSPTDADGDIQPNLLPGLAAQQNNFLSANPIGNPTGLLNLGILGLDDKLQLDMQLQAGEENRQGKVISSPRVVTLDNKQATIKQGVAIKFTEVTSDKINTSFVDAVLELKVTPHITANRSIIMKLGVSKNSPNLSTATGDIVGINKNETKTEAILRDGETMVLGGIYVVDNGHSSTKVPFLADIPGIGAFFRNNVVQDERRELLVFVTPRIVQGFESDVQ